jgi:hypothetical protein
MVYTTVRKGMPKPTNQDSRENQTQNQPTDKTTVRQDIRRIKWFVRKYYVYDDVEYIHVKHLGNREYEVVAKVWDNPFVSLYLVFRLKVNEDGWIKVLEYEEY